MINRAIYNIYNELAAITVLSEFGADKEKKADELLNLIKEIADGKPTKNELLGNREIAIFKDGVTV
jgi:altronate dehydratase